MTTRDDTPNFDALRALGFDALGTGHADDESANDGGFDDDKGFDDVRRRIAAHLTTTQRVWREKSVVARTLPFVGAFILGAILIFVLKPDPAHGTGKLLATVLAGLSGTLALIGTALAPSSPARGEGVAKVALLTAGIALVVEGWVASTMSVAGDFGLPCFLISVGGGILPLVVVSITLRASGLPVRRWHAMGATLAGVAIAGASVWLHCPSTVAMHLIVGHMALPALFVFVGGLLIAPILGRRAL